MKASLRTYILGFILSVLLTLSAFYAVTRHILMSKELVFAVIILALLQFVVQVLFFLHVGREEKTGFRLIMFVSTLSVILVIVIASLLIMSNLNYRHEVPADINTYMKQTEGF